MVVVVVVVTVVAGAEAPAGAVTTTVSSFLLQPASAATAASEPQPASRIQDRFVRVMGSPEVGTQESGVLLGDRTVPWFTANYRATPARVGTALLASDGYPPGKNGLPIEAGMLMRMNDALREISTSTTIVATYGIIVRNWLAICTPSPCRWNCSIVTPPNR